MGDASGLLGFLATLAICYMISSGSEDGLRREPTWRVATAESVPFLMKKTARIRGNEDYEGYIPDVLKKIGEQLHQTYTIYDVGNWTGVITDLLDKKADLAAGPISITHERKEEVSFTEPLFSVRMVILIKKGSKGLMSAKKLLGQTDLTIGVFQDATILQLIHNSTLPHFQKISTDLKANPKLVIPKSMDGANRVRSEGGKFALMTNSVHGLYWANQEPCDIVEIETGLSETEKAFAVAGGSPIKARLDAAITQLRRNGELVKIRQKWWKDHCSSGALNSWGALIVSPLVVMVLVVAKSPGLN